MSPYRLVARLALVDRLAYRGDALLALVAAGVRLAFAYALWSAVFAGRAAVAGFNLAQMTAYYLVSIAVFQLDQSEGYVWEFAGEIRRGDFHKYQVRPLDPRRYFYAVCLGRTGFNLAVLAAIFTAVAALSAVGGRGIGAFAPSSPAALAAALATAGLGLGALASLNYMTALLAFRFQDITAFHMVKSNLVELLSGLLLPLAVLPPWLSVFCAWTPFPALASLPAELWLGRGWEGLPAALARLAAWNVGLYLAAGALYRRLAERYEGVGA
jgi:ABC-2 type transport system permease protein